MKRLYLAAVVAAGCLLATACSGGNADTRQSKGADVEATSMGESSISESEASKTPHESMPEESLGGQASEGLPAAMPKIQVLENLGVEKELLTGAFCKAGDPNVHLSFFVVQGEDGDAVTSKRLGISISVLNAESREQGGLWEYVEIVTESGKTEYQIPVKLYGSGHRAGEDEEVDEFDGSEETDISGGLNEAANNKEGTFNIHMTFGRNNPTGVKISVKGGGLLEGDYYDERQLSRLAPELLSRYLCRAELCAYPAEQLKLLRNTIYAAHGRKFQTINLSRYFEEQPWYRGTVEPEAFDESQLSDVEKKNIELIKELEQRDEKSLKGDQAYALENLDFAPYLSFLDQNSETGLYVDLSQAKDCGVYFSVPGKIALPVAVTQDQLTAVDGGETIELCTNEVTGERQLFRHFGDAGYVLYKEGDPPKDLEYPSDVGVSFNYDTGLYELWVLSDDTVMKPVYEGEIYILKGAVAGWGISVEQASQNQKEIFPGVGADAADVGEAWETRQAQEYITGNALRHNGRGYFTAIYSLGD